MSTMAISEEEICDTFRRIRVVTSLRDVCDGSSYVVVATLNDEQAKRTTIEQVLALFPEALLLLCLPDDVNSSAVNSIVVNISGSTAKVLGIKVSGLQ